MSALPQVLPPDAAIFTVSVAAKLAGMHPQTLRTYDRMGLVVPSRTKGSGRRYTPTDVRKLRLIQHLSHEEGINLSGIKRIIELTDELARANERVEQLTELVQLFSAHEQAERVFSAGVGGAAYFGRRPPRPLALPVGNAEVETIELAGTVEVIE